MDFANLIPIFWCLPSLQIIIPLIMLLCFGLFCGGKKLLL